MAILNYTTKIDPIKTISEIQQCLVKHGARKIITDFDSSGLAVGVTFHVELDGQAVYFALPCNWQGVLLAMQKDKKIPRSNCTAAQAQRTGWRIVKDWIEAQMAIVEAGLASVPEVMLPYALLTDGQTMYQRMKSDRTLLLG
ncbi:hypothetical protein [Spirosoma sp.]|uniref:hypothetical protein n=1 Tax=Spirosoma sp. TaxID=1899569 RepID=UPI002615190A|nr:hypothetical protein [Spirosoma sp.]MCX6216519.1 hypothetical protein [Spirosoma sp.]